MLRNQIKGWRWFKFPLDSLSHAVKFNDALVEGGRLAACDPYFNM